jgi:hypothetical protein
MASGMKSHAGVVYTSTMNIHPWMEESFLMTGKVEQTAKMGRRSRWEIPGQQQRKQVHPRNLSIAKGVGSPTDDDASCVYVVPVGQCARVALRWQ